jgi:hypothetical protein
MSSASNSSGDLYHFAENGITKGPFTARQLKQLADAGHIQAQTLIWKEGMPEWAPATRFKGLLALPGPAFQAIGEGPPPNQARTVILLGIILGGVALLGLVVVVVVLLLGQGSGPAAPDRKEQEAKKSNSATKQNPQPRLDPPAKKPDPPRLDPPVELTADALLNECRKDPPQAIRKWKGKRVLLKVEAIWEVESDKIKTDAEGNLNFTFGRTKDRANAQPNEVIWFSFPLGDPSNKLSFIAKIKAYAEQRKRGEKVVMSVTGVVTNFLMKGKDFLRVEQAVLN